MPDSVTDLQRLDPLVATVKAVEPILARAYEFGDADAVLKLHAVIALLDKVERKLPRR